MKPGPTELHGSLATIGGMAALLWLAWRVLTLGAADHLATIAPERALQWRDGHDQALLEAARWNIGSAPEVAARHARDALRANPLQGVAYRVLAMQAPPGADAAALHSIAAARAPRDVPSLAWLADRALARADYANALAHFDQILRIEPGALAVVTPALVFMARQPSAHDALATLLASRPPWRTSVVLVLAKDAPDMAALAGLFDRVEKDAALSQRERAAWLDRLVREREWTAAYSFWIEGLPAERRKAVGNVYNGGFEWEPTNDGFDWRLLAGNGVHPARSIGNGITGDAALRVLFDHGRPGSRQAMQLLSLPAGSYELDGRVRVERLQASQGLAWSLACAEGGVPFARSRSFSGSHDWQPFSTPFEVPARDCGAQWLRLRDSGPAGETIDGSIWFDDLRIRRVENAPPGGSNLHSGLR